MNFEYEPLPEGPFGLIAADPPWNFKAWSKLGLGRAPERHYQTQLLDWICGIPVKEVAAKNCHLMLWITGPCLAQGYHIPVLSAWGFKPSSMALVWVKPKKRTGQGQFFGPPLTEADFFMGLGKTTRQNAEYVVLGRRGNPRRMSKAVHQLIVEERREHSRKPEAFYAKALKYAGEDVRRLELFPRERRPGWEVWGNEIDKFSKEAA